MSFLRCSLSALLMISAAASCPADDGSTVPPVVYELEINGETHEVVPGKPLTIPGEFKNLTVTLRVAETRRFQAAGMAFDYPANFTYEADVSDRDVRTWTISGSNVTLIVFQFSETVTPEELADSTANALAAKMPQSQPIKLKLGDAERAGVKATMRFATQTLIQQIVALPTAGSGSRLLVIQEVRAERQPEAAELPATLKLLSESLKLQP